MEIKRKQCIFCPDGTSFKGKEHVFPQWVLEELNFRNQIRPFSETQNQVNDEQVKFETFVRRRNNYASFVSPFICDVCNNGWMSNLEGKVKPVLLPLINGTGSLNNLSEDEKTLISRWAIKTTCVMDSVNPSKNPIFIAAEPKQIRNKEALLRGWAVFAKIHKSTEPIGYLSNDYWWVEGNVSKELRENLKRFRKTLIQIKNLILVTVFLGDAKLKLKAVQSLHFPLDTNLEIEWILEPDSPSYVGFKHSADDSTVNIMSRFGGALSLRVL